MVQKALAYDLGGTKISVGIVDARGRILEEVRVPVAIRSGKAGVIRQLSELGKNFLASHRKVRCVGIASAGPLDPQTGTLLDPTNLVEPGGKSWGKVPLARLLSQKLKKPVVLENDAAAAILAEHWIGAARGYDDAMILTLGTGLGTGIIANGELVRAGRCQHPEAGHIIINPTDYTAPCGCGNLGCAEAYLSGRHFTWRARERLGRQDLSTVQIAELARGGDEEARAAFDEYADMMAVALYSYAVIYCPRIVVFAGSFALAADLFLDRAREQLERRLARRRIGVDLMPKLAISSLSNNAGLIGAATIALHGTSAMHGTARPRSTAQRGARATQRRSQTSRARKKNR